MTADNDLIIEISDERVANGETSWLKIYFKECSFELVINLIQMIKEVSKITKRVNYKLIEEEETLNILLDQNLYNQLLNEVVKRKEKWSNEYKINIDDFYALFINIIRLNKINIIH